MVNDRNLAKYLEHQQRAEELYEAFAQARAVTTKLYAQVEAEMLAIHKPRGQQQLDELVHLELEKRGRHYAAAVARRNTLREAAQLEATLATMYRVGR